MNESECLRRMVAPGQHRPGKYRGGVVQVHAVRSCDKACFNCTQGSQYGGKPTVITLANFERALVSLQGYFGVVGLFGGNPATHPQFPELCELMRKHVHPQQRGIWCNNPRGYGKEMRRTFDPAVSNLNVHMDRAAYDEFRRDWPESRPFGLDKDSLHAPVFVSMMDLGVPEEERWELISRCDINQHWSAMLCQVEGELKAYFCEIAGAQAMLTDDGSVGMDPAPGWWTKPMSQFVSQVEKHCHRCGVPMRGRGEPAVCGDAESLSASYGSLEPKRKGRRIELVLAREDMGSTHSVIDYMGVKRGRTVP